MRYPCINHSNRPSVNKAALVAVVIAAVLMLSGISGKGQTRALQLSIKDSTGRQVGLYSESHALVIGGGYDDWRMPTQEELSALYNKGKSYRASQRNCSVHLTGLIQLSACYTWASEANDDEAAYFGFSAGSRYSSFKSATYRYRALPARDSK